MKQTGITQFLLDHAGRGPVSFHMPGHKGSRIYQRYGYGDFLKNIMDCDITEIAGADNLFQMEGIIAETAAKYRDLYDVKASYLLINGTSGGLIASALAAVPPGKKLIMARNCHKSVFNALTLGHIEPVYAYPTVMEDYGISGPMEPAEIGRLLEENPDAEAVLLPSPNYYGVCSDIRAIAETVHRHGKVLIVDQAHGAHLHFFHKYGCRGELPLPAEACGADVVVNSAHKTLASFTQSAVLNLNSDRIQTGVLEDKLQAVESTSPSYLLMASLDINADLIADHGRELFSAWKKSLADFYAAAKTVPGLKIMEAPGHMDATKINVDLSALGLDGSALEKRLLQENIFAELVTGNILMCMTGIGNSPADLERLLNALKKIAGEKAAFLQKGQGSAAADVSGGALDSRAQEERRNAPVSSVKTTDQNAAGFLWTKGRPLHKIPRDKELLELDRCAGRICAASIIPYPPGIPLICPGEEIGPEEIAYIKALRSEGRKVIGVDERLRVAVGCAP